MKLCYEECNSDGPANEVPARRTNVLEIYKRSEVTESAKVEAADR
jgi:hypothetical protein